MSGDSSNNRWSSNSGLRWTIPLLFFLAASASILYGPFLNNPLLQTDLHDHYKYKTVLYLQPKDLLGFQPSSVFRPFFWFFIAMVDRLFGANPVAKSVLGLILHIANSTLVALLAYSLTQNKAQTILSGFFYCLWYLHGEALLYRAAHIHLLGTFWFLLSLISYIHYRRKGSLPLYLASALLFYIAAFSNPSTVSLVFLGLLYDMVYRPPDLPPRRVALASFNRLSPFLPAVFLLAAASHYRGNMGTFYAVGLNMPKNLVTIFSHPWYQFGPQGVTEILLRSQTVSGFLKALLDAPNRNTILLLLLSAFSSLVLLAWRSLKGERIERFSCLFFILAFVPYLAFKGLQRRYFIIPIIGLAMGLAHWVCRLLRPEAEKPLSAHLIRLLTCLLLGGWLAYQVSFIRQEGKNFRSAGTIVQSLLGDLEDLGPFGPDERLFLKGVPEVYNNLRIFHPEHFEDFLRLHLDSPGLQVRWLDKESPFPPYSAGARFFLYRGKKLKEVGPKAPR